MLKEKKIAIIGGGNLGSAIAVGLVESHELPPNQVHITRRQAGQLAGLARMGMVTGTDNRLAIRDAGIVLLAVKPYHIEKVIRDIVPVLQKDQVLVSLATGVSLAHLREWSENRVKVFRAMPNTAAAVASSITCICSENGSRHDEEMVEQVFSGIGETVIINEGLMEAATVLGACGIAYVLRFIRAMIQGGIEIGFSAHTATLIASHTVRGATELLIENKKHPEAEIDKVTTPKGCTIAGLNEMEHQGFSSSLIKGILTSFEKIEKI